MFCPNCKGKFDVYNAIEENGIFYCPDCGTPLNALDSLTDEELDEEFDEWMREQGDIETALDHMFSEEEIDLLIQDMPSYPHKPNAVAELVWELWKWKKKMLKSANAKNVITEDP